MRVIWKSRINSSGVEKTLTAGVSLVKTVHRCTETWGRTTANAHICWAQLHPLLLWVNYRVFLHVCLRVIGPQDLGKMSYMQEDKCTSWRAAEKPMFGSVRLTARTMAGRPHSVLRSLWLCRRPPSSRLRSSTSTPITLGFIGFGYFLIAALMTVSHG